MSKFSPAHYKKGKIEVWDFIIDQELNYVDGCMVKYICRAGEKEGETRLDDLLKVKAYITKAISTEIEINATSSTRPDESGNTLPTYNGSACWDEGYTCPCHAAEADS